ncbi:hypothetical protein RJ640_006757 [Escallonia rubra]|uniref:Ycf20 n=1 Tax=Escallonia rubra TaxID=112253 RepID=A0AA88U4P3_9ASTE|nr:hypothetical protein RJ640_006757 [Escallonia rubra]
MPSLGNLTSTRLPTAESFRSRFTALHFAAYLHRATLLFGNMLNARLCVSPEAQLYFVTSSKRGSRSIRCSVSGSGSTPSSTNSTRSGTRLTRTIRAFQIKLIARIKELKRDFPVKLLFFLVGFYCATVFVTVIGQTGDWDILSAALSVTVVEAIGALMYGASLSKLKKVKDLITMFNYWKAGVSLGFRCSPWEFNGNHKKGRRISREYQGTCGILVQQLLIYLYNSFVEVVPISMKRPLGLASSHALQLDTYPNSAGAFCHHYGSNTGVSKKKAISGEHPQDIASCTLDIT